MRTATNPTQVNPMPGHRASGNQTPGRQQGVGLIEVLIAVLVLSIGFLGIAALQAKSLANNNSAMTRTQASIAAYSMFDAMRVDKAAALAGNYNKTITAGACPAANGTLAENQLRTWCLGYDASNPPSPLPPANELGGLAALGAGAKGVINCLGNTTAANCSITITFNDSRATGGNAAQAMTFWTQL